MCSAGNKSVKSPVFVSIERQSRRYGEYQCIGNAFVPLGVAALNGHLYVSYTQQDAAKHDETTGAGMGYVDVFDFSGNFVNRFASAGVLNAPWGMAVAPAGFGSLVFGNGDTDKPVTTLFYAAGLADQTDGVFGSIAVTTAIAPNPYTP